MNAFRQVELIGSTIRNGRIYFSSTDINFFPADSLGDRKSDGHKGETVTFILGNDTLETDIRVSSGQRISPRKTFAPYLKKLRAVEGGMLKVTRLSDREYNVTYIAP